MLRLLRQLRQYPFPENRFSTSTAPAGRDPFYAVRERLLMADGITKELGKRVRRERVANTGVKSWKRTSKEPS